MHSCNVAHTRMAGFARALQRDDRGVAGIEFALILPILMLLLLGVVEASRAIDMDRHFSIAVSNIGDAVARQESIGTNEGDAKLNLDGAMKAIAHIMAPYDANEKDLQVVVASVQASHDDATDTKVVWSYSHGEGGLSVPAKCSTYTLPDGLVPKGGSVIIVEAEYKHKPLFGDFVPGFGSLMKFTEKSFYNPRNSCVDYIKNQNCISPC